ncbi:hypothetical protein COLO4_03400 [Corchorus olitorius]|uniref:Uncharacterized protein n=1 Tax=Corchorus olitorius TaxID=93759 RepID=A0A1R3KYN4_9ROSI|nr:hypothetical protein COLO4_03400 [Corchorus olitorius]
MEAEKKVSYIKWMKSLEHGVLGILQPTPLPAAVDTIWQVGIVMKQPLKWQLDKKRRSLFNFGKLSSHLDDFLFVFYQLNVPEEVLNFKITDTEVETHL